MLSDFGPRLCRPRMRERGADQHSHLGPGLVAGGLRGRGERVWRVAGGLHGGAIVAERVWMGQGAGKP